MAEREGTSFIAEVDEVQEVRIEALTTWQNTFAGGCAARLQFRHPERGSVSVELPKRMTCALPSNNSRRIRRAADRERNLGLEQGALRAQS